MGTIDERPGSRASVAPGPRVRRSLSVRVALTYFVLSTLWILVSDWALQRLIDDPSHRTLWSVAKGWTFVGGSALLLFVYLRRWERERRRAETTAAQVSHAEGVVASVVAASPVAIVATDPQGRVVLWNPSATRMFGWPPEDALGAPVPFIPAERRDAFLALLDMERSGAGAPGGVRVSAVRRDGSTVRVRASFGPLRDGERVIGAMALLADETELASTETARDEARASLVESERRYRQLFDDNPYPLFLLDVESRRFLAANEATLALFGYDRDAFLALRGDDVRPPSDVPRFIGELQHAHGDLETSAPGRFSFLGRRIYTRADGSEFIADLSASPVEWDGRKAMLALVLDASELEAAERASRALADRVDAIRDLAHAVVVADTLEEIASALARRLRADLDATSVGVVLYQGDEAVFVGADPVTAETGVGERFSLESLIWRPRSIEDRTIFTDLSTLPPGHERDDLLDVGQRSLIVVPLERQGELVGHVYATASEVGAFDDRSAAAVDDLASEFSIALQHAFALEELRRRSADLELLRDLDRAVASGLDADAVLRGVLELLLRQLGGECAVAVVGEGDADGSVVVEPDTEGSIPWVGSSGTPVDDLEIRTFDLGPDGAPIGGRRFARRLHIPVISQGRRIGSVDVVSSSSASFTEEDLRTTHAVKEELSVAFVHAISLQGSERRRRMLELAQHVDRSVTVSGSLEEVGRALATRLGELLAAQRTGVFLHDGERSVLLGVSGPASEQVSVGERFPRSAFAPDLIGFEIREPFVSPGLRIDDADVGSLSERTALFGAGSVLSMPVTVAGEFVGNVFATMEEQRASRPADLELLVTAADEFGLAVRHFRAISQLAERTEHLVALSEITKGILSGGSVEEISSRFTERILRFTDTDRAAVLTFDRDAEMATLIAMHEREPFEPKIGSRLPREMFGRLWDGTEASVWTPDTGGDRPPIVDRLRAEGIQTAFAKPLATTGRSMGMLAVGSRDPGGLPLEMIAFLGEAADQLAIVLEQAAFREELAARARALEVLATDRRRLLDRLVAAQEEERTRVARDLHDSLGQTLTSLALFAAKMERGPLEQIRSDLPTLRGRLASAVRDLRGLVRTLRPTELDEGLGVAVTQLVAAATEGIDAQVDVLDVLEGRRFDGAIEATIYRVVQEAVTNAVRHAAPSAISVVLSMLAGQLVAIVEDRGRGYDTATAPTGYGTRGMRERAAQVNGRLTIESAVGVGTIVRLEVPVE